MKMSMKDALIASLLASAGMFLALNLAIRKRPSLASYDSIAASPTGGAKGFIFFKTHKTASSTVTSIILRKCVRERWNCFVPPVEHPG